MCVRRRARECVCSRRRDYEWERCGGFASLQGGGEVDFFSHPFFMAFLLSDLQSLYIRLTGRFSFIFKHLLGTRCVCLVAFWGGGGGGWWWRHGSRLRHAVFHRALMTISPRRLLRWCSFAAGFMVLITPSSKGYRNLNIQRRRCGFVCFPQTDERMLCEISQEYYGGRSTRGPHINSAV